VNEFLSRGLAGDSGTVRVTGWGDLLGPGGSHCGPLGEASTDARSERFRSGFEPWLLAFVRVLSLGSRL